MKKHILIGMCILFTILLSGLVSAATEYIATTGYSGNTDSGWGTNWVGNIYEFN